MFNFGLNKSNSSNSDDTSERKIPSLSGERDALDAGIIAANLDSGTDSKEDFLPFESESNINIPKIPYSSPLQEAYKKHDENIAKMKEVSEQSSELVSAHTDSEQINISKNSSHSSDNANKLADLKTEDNTISVNAPLKKDTGDNNIIKINNDRANIPSSAPENQAKAPVVTMLDAIKSKAGEKEKNKWLKHLEKEKKVFQSKKSYEDPNSPEAVFNKHFSEQIEHSPQGMSVNLDDGKTRAEVKTYKPLSIRTFKSDLQNLMQQDKLSLTKIVAIESDRRKYNKEAKKIKKEKQYSYFAFTILGMAILLTVSLLSYAAYLQYHNDTAPSAIDNLASQEVSLLNPLIFIEDKIRIDITDKPRIYVLRVLQAARDSTKINSALGNVTELELVKKYQNKFYKISSKEMLSILNPRADDIFKESLKQQYMVGVHIDDKGRQSFAIFTINSYQFVFAAMLNWEKYMEQDAGIFLDPKYRTAYASAFDNEEKFKDAVLKNYSVRVLYDKNGKVKLLYGFIGQDTLIITSSAKTFLELAARISVEKGL